MIPLLHAQSYSNISEIIVVDDESTDGSADFLKTQDITYLRSKPRSALRKKEGLKLALSHAKGDIIVQTDADCWVGEHWVERMAGSLDAYARLIQGPLTYRRSHKVWSGILESEQAVLNALSGSGISIGRPALGNAANMAYFRGDIDPDLDLGVNGSVSGDDEEIISAVIEKYGPSAVRFNKEPDAMVFARGPEGIQEFFYQRLRWDSKVKLRGLTKVGLDSILFSLTNFLLLGLVVAAMFKMITWDLVATYYGVKYLIDLRWFITIWPFYRPPDCGKGWLLDSLILVIFYPFYTFFFAVLSKFVPFKWKNQKIAPWTRSSGTS